MYTKEELKKAFDSIEKMDDSYERLGFEICATLAGEFPCEEGEDYRTIGKDLTNLILMNPDQIEIINKTLIAITGWSLVTLKERMKDHKKYYDAL